ncbi:MAG: adenosine kinase [Acidobacteria bacterium]|uniref:Adenosine kinase n=1 Tax=Candidatus Polarisedimenticola svalbardensis TaxID=2886004 RepID=A0A8J7CDS2_9BACT|nr:adenosine kinase [Candidatus Polarisedimenticola svalbardensis]
MSDPKRDVVGIGNAIVDILVEVDDRFLEEQELAKGTMALIDSGQALELYRKLNDYVEQSGGSAANTMAGIASLGGSAGFIGRVRDDELGASFTRDIQKAGVEYTTEPAKVGPSTGRCIVLVTPDGERTMQTYLGACAALSMEDLDEAMIATSSITYLEGYLWDPPEAKEAFLAAAAMAHGAGRKVSLSLSDPFCVERHRGEFQDLVENHVDILLGNESEILSLYETENLGAALDRVGSSCELTAVTLGAEGAAVVTEQAVRRIPALPVKNVVDTTGAGDLFAAGFLYATTHGATPVEAARTGGICAAVVISQFGARPKERLSDLI